MRRSGPNMRLTHQRMAGRYDNTPESVLDWLEEQLECRGIDALVYTRYILSLLQDYDTDDELAVDGVPSMSRRSLKRHNSYNTIACVKDNLKPVTTQKFKHKRYLNTTNALDLCPDADYCPTDEQRKLAVVQCLKSASEQELGIESFVDELCAKLKNIKVLSEDSAEISVDTTVEANTPAKISPKEQAMKYYAAFPALDCNSNEEGMASKTAVSLVLTEDFNRNSMDRNKWNGQKIIGFITSNQSLAEGLDMKIDDQKPSDINGNEDQCLKLIKKEDQKTDSEGRNGLTLDKKFIYCEDIESDVKARSESMADVCPLVVSNDSSNRSDKLSVIETFGEEKDRIERLVNKFNSNIASIWSTTGVGPKLDNIWSFDSSFSSNQSSATPSPKSLAIDFWSTLSVNELSQSLADKSVPPMPALTDCWQSSILHSYHMFPDDGFIDGNHDLIDDEPNWNHFTEKTKDEANRTTLENHKKNSPFVEFISMSGSKAQTNGESESQSLTKLLAAVLEQSADHRPSPTLSEENLLTSSRTHFQPIRQDSFDRDSDDGSNVDITDTEVNKLVICSDKCPNNVDHKMEDTTSRLTIRPISTSFRELASFMGPFADTDPYCADDYQVLSTDSQSIPTTDSKMRDKSTNTETENQMNPKTKLTSIVETSAESEPEYQDLYDMINEVLRNGISEEDCPLGSSVAALADDWYESDGGTECMPELYYGAERKKRLSWNCYLDTYECPIGPSDTQSHSPVNPLSDDVFGDELLFTDGSQYEDVFGDYFQSDDTIGYVSDEHRVFDLSAFSANKEMNSFGPQLGLQMRRRQPDAVRKSRKPCTYFIEGNCKRSDCKYSHDISGITCKYWEEGFCFKADLCPFLHGYADEDNSVRTEDNLPLTTSALNSYVIESESDFPALSTNGLSEEGTGIWYEPEPVFDVEQHLLEIKAKSLAAHQSHHGKGAATVSLSKSKLPIAVFMKKKAKKRKDRNLQ